MKNHRIIRPLLPALTVLLLVLELLPYGVVLRFAQPEGDAILQTYSYFDLTPWGYATFTPLLTALLSVALLVLTLAALFRRKRNIYKLNSSIITVSLLAAALSLIPVLTGTFTAVAAAVTASLLLIGGLSLINRVKHKENVDGTDG